MIRRISLLVLLPLLTGAVAFWAAYFVFYRGGYEPPPPAEVPIRGLASSGVSPGVSTDPSTLRARRGLVLVDALHSNGFVVDELLALQTRVTDRGYEMVFLGGSGDAGPANRLQVLEAGLRGADSLMVVLPEDPYSPGEVALVERFVEKGGKLLLVSDPGRPHQLNSLAKAFGLKFQPDYLYNQVEHDLNFRNIFVKDFQPDEITSGLDSISLYGVGSIESSGTGLAFGDVNTLSSLVESGGRHSPIARGDRRNVVALADFTFMVPPYASLLDNAGLLSNIADYLTASERSYELADFPYFYGEDLDILAARPSLLSIGLELKNGLSAYELSAQVTDVEDISRDTVFLGLYEDALQVSQSLQAAGIRVDDTLGTPFSPELGLEGTAITVLDQNQDRQVLLVLSSSPETLSTAVSRLLSGDFRRDLLSDDIAVGGPVGATRPVQVGGPVEPERSAGVGR